MIKKNENFDKLKALKTYDIYLFLNQLTFRQRSIYKKTLTNKSFSVLEKITEISNFDQLLISNNSELEKFKMRRGGNVIYNSQVSIKELMKSQELNFNLSNLYLFRYLPNRLFIQKFSNFLMKHGLKGIAMQIILKFFEILKQAFHILNPIEMLRKFLFVNLVPVIKPKTVGFKVKKVIGITLSIYKRISTSFKLFIKGARSHNVPMAEGFVIEFFNFYKQKTLLQQTNIQILAIISENNLYKAIQVGNNSYLTPEKYYMMENFNKVGIYKFSDLLEIDWENFNDIILYLYDYNLKRKLFRQLCVFEQLRFYSFYYFFLQWVKLQEEESNRNKLNNPIDSDSNDYLKSISDSDDSDDSDDFEDYSMLENYFDDSYYESTLNTQNKIKTSFRKRPSQYVTDPDLSETDINAILLDDEKKKNKSYNETDEDIFSNLTSSQKIESFFYFKEQLIQRLPKDITENLKLTDFIDFYNCKNPNNIDLDITLEQFQNLPLVIKIFTKIKIWDLDEFTLNSL
jgi:ribosomal protein S7